MLKQIINIGLESSKRFQKEYTEQEILQKTLQFLNSKNIEYTYSIKKSNTENTIVLYVYNQSITHSDIQFLSDSLSQDCIAVYSVKRGAGRLVGSFNKAWGHFNREYFLI